MYGFSQGGQNLTTAALPGQPLAAARDGGGAGRPLPVPTRATVPPCEVHANGQAVRTPPDGGARAPPARRTSSRCRCAAKTKKASRFFSIKSWGAGFKNNLLGMVVKTRAGRKEKEAFNDRMSEEQRIKLALAAKKAAKARAPRARPRARSAMRSALGGPPTGGGLHTQKHATGGVTMTSC